MEDASEPGVSPCCEYLVTVKRKSHNQSTASRKKADNTRIPRATRVIDFDRYIPTVVSSLMAKLRSSAQIFFEERYGITRLEWRIISFLASEGPSSAYDIWTLGSLDKAAVSRAVKALQARGLVQVKEVPNNNRRRTLITLTVAGRKLSDQTFDEIVRRHGRLVAKLTNAEIEQFIATAKHLEQQISLMDDQSYMSASRFDVTKSSKRSPPGRTTAVRKA